MLFKINLLGKVKSWFTDETSASHSPEIGLYILFGAITVIGVMYYFLKSLPGLKPTTLIWSPKLDP